MKRLYVRSTLLFVTLFFCIASLYVLYREDRRGVLTVAFLNIGQGDAVFIDAPNGNQLLIDGGPSRSILRELAAIMPFYDKSIDVVIATHADQDHVGGLPDVLNTYKVGLFVEPGVPGGSSSYTELERLVADGAPQKILARAPMVVDLGGGVELEILFPLGSVEGFETNESSIVARLVYGESEFLLTGDAPLSTERILLSKREDIRADVLKVGHHGSKTSTSDAFVKAVKPQIAVISAGKDNRYGHPHQEVLTILQNNNIQTKNTAEVGRVVFKTDGVVLKTK